MTLIAKLEKNEYKVFRKIGEGASGEIFEVEVLKTGEKAAMKVTSFRNRESQREIFQREVRISRKLNNHPNIVRLIDEYIIDDEFGVMIMEKMDCDLMDYMLASPSFSVQQIHSIYNEICKSVHHLHQNGIFHCDLKPENVLLNIKNGKIINVKLCDFGFAVDGRRKTNSFAKFGTLEYLPPEALNLFNGIGEVIFEKVDVWSMGVILFVMLTGLFPFINRNQSLFAIDVNRLPSMMKKYKFNMAENFDWIVENNRQKWVNIIDRIFDMDLTSRPNIGEILQLISDVQVNIDIAILNHRTNFHENELIYYLNNHNMNNVNNHNINSKKKKRMNFLKFFR